MPARAHPFRRFDELERLYDGPIAPSDPATLGRPCPEARARLFARLAAETRSAAACRRSRLDAASAAADTRLRDLADSLGFYRCQGVAWRF